MTNRERSLLKITLAPWLSGSVTFDEWCAAVDEILPLEALLPVEQNVALTEPGD